MKDRRKPWQKAVESYKWARCGTIAQETWRNAFGKASTRRIRSDAGWHRYSTPLMLTIGEIEARGLVADTPLLYRPK